LFATAQCRIKKSHDGGVSVLAFASIHQLHLQKSLRIIALPTERNKPLLGQAVVTKARVEAQLRAKQKQERHGLCVIRGVLVS
jgi:hypothetical protein